MPSLRYTRVLLFFGAASLGAQSSRTPPTPRAARIPELVYASDLTIDLAKEGVRRVGFLSVSDRGRMVVAQDRYYGEMVAFDSLGRKLPWSIKIGRDRDSEIAWMVRTGWVAESDSMWIDDGFYGQLALLDGNGKLVN